MATEKCILQLKDVNEKLEHLKENLAQPNENDKTSAAFFKQAAVEWVKVICDAQHIGKDLSLIHI